MNAIRLMSYRFDPPGGWRWLCRFSLAELKKIYSKLFGYKRFKFHKNDEFIWTAHYDVGKGGWYGVVRLEDGGMKSLESCSKEELDWFLLIGKSFLVDDLSIDWQTRFEEQTANPLFGKVSREEALIALDLVGECDILKTTDHNLVNKLRDVSY